MYFGFFKLNFQVSVSVLEKKTLDKMILLELHSDNCFETQMKTQEIPH